MWILIEQVYTLEGRNLCILDKKYTGGILKRVKSENLIQISNLDTLNDRMDIGMLNIFQVSIECTSWIAALHIN